MALILRYMIMAMGTLPMSARRKIIRVVPPTDGCFWGIAAKKLVKCEDNAAGKRTAALSHSIGGDH